MTVTARTPRLAQLIAKYDGRAPRYTSYPTAVQFRTDVGPRLYRRWLSELPLDEAVSLYLHIPFCARLCWYCGCNTRGVTRHQPVATYVERLIEELALLREALPARLSASAVHLGGGTPNMLQPQELETVVEALDAAFDRTPGAEFAAELDPAVLTQEWVATAAALGLNRASLGVQNLSPRVQQAVNRPETLAEIARCVGWLRQAGVASVNLDLMYGLPHQTVENTLTTLEGVLSLQPDRLALFGYAHVPWMKPHQKLIEDSALPGAAERLDQSIAAANYLTSQGYVQIGLDHFAAPSDPLAKAARAGRLHRNFQGYTTDQAGTVLGLGASAIGSLPQGYVQNASDEVAWRDAVGRGELSVARGVVKTEEDRFRGEIIERLMCDFAVDLKDVCARHGRPLAELWPERQRLTPFVADGLVSLDGGRLNVTPAGQLLVRSVCAVFDEYLAPAAQRHARAI